MSLIVPERAKMQLRESKVAADRLGTLIKRNGTPWTKDQQEQLATIFDVIKQTRDALYNIVEANK